MPDHDAWTPKVSSEPMTALRRPLSTATVRAWGIEVSYGGEAREHAVMVLDGRVFDVAFDLGDEGETIGTDRDAPDRKYTLTEVTTIEVTATQEPTS